MLFIFEKPGVYGFWMKNMVIPVDIIFIDENKKVVHIEERVQPCENDPCKIYRPKSPVKYVLEVKAGFIRENFPLCVSNTEGCLSVEIGLLEEKR